GVEVRLTPGLHARELYMGRFWPVGGKATLLLRRRHLWWNQLRAFDLLSEVVNIKMAATRLFHKSIYSDSRYKFLTQFKDALAGDTAENISRYKFMQLHVGILHKIVVHRISWI
ncbi:hypothetical protein NDU88_000991, partial [Pleurodeles waltl]